MTRLSPNGVAVALAGALLVAACSSSGANGTGGTGGSGGGMDAGMEPDGSMPGPTCNGHEELCDRAFDEVAYPMTHNAMSNAAAGWLSPNQNFGITTQLDAGIRGLMLDTYDVDGELLLCHLICSEAVGQLPLVDGLDEIRAFLEGNPDEVVSIIFENYISNAQTASAFEDSGLIDFVYAQEIGEPWPTLGDLIAADTRLVVFQESLPTEDEFPWLMNIWEYAWETHFSAAAPEDFSCDPNRGDPDNPLFLINHFLTGVLGGSPAFAEMVNYNPFFIDRVNQCEDESGDFANFIAVDFYDIGDVLEVVDEVNGF